MSEAHIHSGSASDFKGTRYMLSEWFN